MQTRDNVRLIPSPMANMIMKTRVSLICANELLSANRSIAVLIFKGITVDTKFVIITHHALTMSRMDRLYGVTMAEQGVSQLVSVDLQRAEELVA